MSRFVTPLLFTLGHAYAVFSHYSQSLRLALIVRLRLTPVLAEADALFGFITPATAKVTLSAFDAASYS